MELLTPLLVQVALTFVLLFTMGYHRVSSISKGQIRVRDIALRQPNWLEVTTRIGNAYHNQLEMPLLFYLLVCLLLITKLDDNLFLILAWGYVVLRLIHAVIHVSTSRARLRFFVFAASSVVLLLMWLRFAVKLI